MPSMVNLFSLAVPRTLADDCRNCSRAADVELVQDDTGNHAGDGPHVGAVRQRFEHFAGDDGLLQAVEVSIRGDWPLTVMDSSSVPISSLKSARETWSEFTEMLR